MIPQQSHDGNVAPSQSDIIVKDDSDSMAIDDQENLTVFGSQQVKETSNTPYTDATQVSNIMIMSIMINIFFFLYLI